ncbi:hypothetical protein GIB67_029782 [Kingdonia uniflora]|uniref:Aminotransferase-like plant mobile domain-containing protein n=1 Tax=Kingdonia uniflora TaxID=39325 RepID=A0A7J7NJJ1_9MAGN|nr:hypothetical protein GIB67_029782 [Kingdonia uniflora]
MVLDESYTEYSNALTIFSNMESKDYEKGCISFAHLQTHIDHSRVNITDPANITTIFRAFMILYFGCISFGNSKSWVRLELLGPIVLIEKRGPTIDSGSAILGHLYYCLDQASKEECYEYSPIGHHNRFDNFWPRMLAWHTKRQKLTGNKVNHHLALMRQQLDLRTINNMQWDPFRYMKDALKWEVIIAGQHVNYDAYWRHVSHGALISNIARCGNIDIPGLGALTARVTFLHIEFPTGDFSTQETQIPPPRLGYDFFAMTEGMQKLTLDRTLDLEARHLHDQSRITHLTTDLRRAKYRLFQLNDYLDGKGVVVDWEDDEGEA